MVPYSSPTFSCHSADDVSLGTRDGELLLGDGVGDGEGSWDFSIGCTPCSGFDATYSSLNILLPVVVSVVSE
jgi:hypothetical protein